MDSKDTQDLLVDLFLLLEVYAPTWYPKELRDRLVTATGGVLADKDFERIELGDADYRANTRQYGEN